jgi:lytic murein transglycosylase
MRAAVLAVALAVAGALAAPPLRAQQEGSFQKFVEGVWPAARAAGVSRATFDRAFKGVTPDLSLPDLVLPGKQPSQTRGQAEFVRPPQDYLNRAQLAQLAQNGKAFLARHLHWLEKIEREIGVERHVVMGIWGRETAYGTHKLPHYAVRVLATQAWTGRRKEMFRTELIAALKLIEDKVITIEAMRSSWAGAMGLPQFMPSELALHAYDLDGDGRKDIWTSVPDALASAAKQLKSKGWISGLSWGFEVVLPAKVDCALEGPVDERPVAEWVRMGLKRIDGKPFPKSAEQHKAYLMSPGGTHGPIFLATENFKVIRAYNTSDLYAVFVGHLSDRIAGGGDFATPWQGIVQMPTADIEETQRLLKERGFAIDRIDGKIGSNTRRQIGQFQRRAGLRVDCWPGRPTLMRLRDPAAVP